MLDVIVIIIVVTFMIVGYLRGILHEVLTVAALGVAYVASARLQGPMGELLLKFSGMAPAFAYTVGRVMGGVLIYISLSLAVRLADKRIGRTTAGHLVAWNRNLGALGGLLFGAFMGFCALSFADVMYKMDPQADTWWARTAGESALRKLVAPHNPADRLLVTDSLKMIRVLRDDPERLEKLKDKEVFQQLLDHPTVKDILSDEELMEAIHNKDVGTVAGNEKIHKLLQDAELRKLMFSDEMRAALKEAVEEDAAEQEAEGEGASHVEG